MAAEGGHHHYPTLTQTKTLEPKSTFLSGKVQQEPKKRKKTEAVKRNSTHCIWCEKKSKWSLICLLFKVVRWVQRSVVLHRQYEDGKTRFWRQGFGLFFNSRDTRPITASPRWHDWGWKGVAGEGGAKPLRGEKRAFVGVQSPDCRWSFCRGRVEVTLLSFTNE